MNKNKTVREKEFPCTSNPSSRTSPTHLQEEIDEQSDNSETDQEVKDRNPTSSINKQDRRSEEEFSGYLYEEFTEELKDHSTMKKDKDSFYDSTSTKDSSILRRPLRRS